MPSTIIKTWVLRSGGKKPFVRKWRRETRTRSQVAGFRVVRGAAFAVWSHFSGAVFKIFSIFRKFFLWSSAFDRKSRCHSAFFENFKFYFRFDRLASHLRLGPRLRSGRFLKNRRATANYKKFFRIFLKFASPSSGAIGLRKNFQFLLGRFAKTETEGFFGDFS